MGEDTKFNVQVHSQQLTLTLVGFYSLKLLDTIPDAKYSVEEELLCQLLLGNGTMRFDNDN